MWIYSQIYHGLLFSSQVAIMTGSTRKRCLCVWKNCFLSSHWEWAGRRGRTPQKGQWGARTPSVGLSGPSQSLDFSRVITIRNGKDAQECNMNRRRVRNYQIGRGGHKKYSHHVVFIPWGISIPLAFTVFAVKVTVKTVLFLKISKERGSITLWRGIFLT